MTMKLPNVNYGQREYPALFTTAMMEANLAGTKTETRRTAGLNAINKNPGMWKPAGTSRNAETGKVVWIFENLSGDGETQPMQVRSPYGGAGDRLWARETFRPTTISMPTGPRYDYRADAVKDGTPLDGKWKPALHMPRKACRFAATVLYCYPQRLHDITEEEAQAEGCDPVVLLPDADGTLNEAMESPEGSYVDGYAALWESINERGSWALNPWVWVVKYSNPFAYCLCPGEDAVHNYEHSAQAVAAGHYIKTSFVCPIHGNVVGAEVLWDERAQRWTGRPASVWKHLVRTIPQDSTLSRDPDRVMDAGFGFQEHINVLAAR